MIAGLEGDSIAVIGDSRAILAPVVVEHAEVGVGC